MSVEEQRRERERQREHQSDQQLLQEAFNQDGDLDKDFLKDVIGVDDFEEALEDYQLRQIQGLVNKEMVLSNLSEAQAHDRWYKLKVMKIMTKSQFPPDESPITGKVRAHLLDDDMAELNPLTQEERLIIDQIFIALQNRAMRSKGGFERKQMETSYAHAERGNSEPKDNSSGVLGGLF